MFVGLETRAAPPRQGLTEEIALNLYERAQGWPQAAARSLDHGLRDKPAVLSRRP